MNSDNAVHPIHSFEVRDEEQIGGHRRPEEWARGMSEQQGTGLRLLEWPVQRLVET